MSITNDRNDPGLKQIKPNGQQEKYLVLSDEERAKGFVNPVFRSYRHLTCGVVTTMGQPLCETYAREPEFYGGTFCCGCGGHFPLINPDGSRAFIWQIVGDDAKKPDGSPFGVGERQQSEAA